MVSVQRKPAIDKSPSKKPFNVPQNMGVRPTLEEFVLVGTVLAAKFLGVSPTTVHRYVRECDLQAYKYKGRFVFYPEDLESWWESHTMPVAYDPPLAGNTERKDGRLASA